MRLDQAGRDVAAAGVDAAGAGADEIADRPDADDPAVLDRDVAPGDPAAEHVDDVPVLDDEIGVRGAGAHVDDAGAHPRIGRHL